MLWKFCKIQESAHQFVGWCSSFVLCVYPYAPYGNHILPWVCRFQSDRLVIGSRHYKDYQVMDYRNVVGLLQIALNLLSPAYDLLRGDFPLLICCILNDFFFICSASSIRNWILIIDPQPRQDFLLCLILIEKNWKNSNIFIKISTVLVRWLWLQQ